MYMAKGQVERMVLDRDVARRFLLILVRNYVFAAAIAVIGIGSAFVFISVNLSVAGRLVVTGIGVISFIIMICAEIVTFQIQSKPIRHIFSAANPSLADVSRAYDFLRKFPIYGVLRIMGPHWLGLALPGLTLIYIATHIHFYIDVPNMGILLEFIATFCVACMHALLEFFLTMRACQNVLLHVNNYAKQEFGQDLSRREDLVIHVRTTFTVSAILIGTLPLLLFTGVTQYHLVTQLNEPWGNYIAWAGFFLGTGLLFSSLGAILIARAVEGPIERLQTGMRLVADGQLDVEVDNVYIDEFSRLVAGFNTMVQFLKERDQVNAQLLESFLTTLATALDARDPYTAGHSVRVARYSVEIAMRAGLSSEDVTIVRNSAILHDVGKIGVRDSVLLKDDRLTDEEYAQIKRHPVIGERILRQIRPSEPIMPLLPGVRSHHERFDGFGYPDGLVGNDIPQLGRILAVADAFDAMTSDRPYRKGMTKEQALAIIESGAGTQWDPIYAHLMVDWMRDVTDLTALHPESDIAVLKDLLQEPTAILQV